MECRSKWNDYFRSHREFILATLFEPDRVHTAAGNVLCEVDGKLVKVRTLVDEIERQTRGQATIPETWEFDFARRVVARAASLGRFEREALMTFARYSPRDLPRLSQEAHEAVADTWRALYADPIHQR
ncbi:MAG: hypothetical protein GDA67_12855 [Nitrospira sp. CR1.3]|nr:hypothetical protein [Nitrospira sp. CR1.3]